MQSLGTLEMVSLHWLTFVKPHTDEKIFYNSGRIFTIRAKLLEKIQETHIVIISANDFIREFFRKGLLGMFGRATILTDRHYKSVFSLYLFIYSIIQYKTAGDGDFQKGCEALSWIPISSGLFASDSLSSGCQQTFMSCQKLKTC